VKPTVCTTIEVEIKLFAVIGMEVELFTVIGMEANLFTVIGMKANEWGCGKSCPRVYLLL
jgi:hypothetical protein